MKVETKKLSLRASRKRTEIKNWSSNPSNPGVGFTRNTVSPLFFELSFQRWLDGCGSGHVCIFRFTILEFVARRNCQPWKTRGSKEKNESKFNPLWSVTAFQFNWRTLEIRCCFLRDPWICCWKIRTIFADGLFYNWNNNVMCIVSRKVILF